jgi:hypothetical protein
VSLWDVRKSLPLCLMTATSKESPKAPSHAASVRYTREIKSSLGALSRVLKSIKYTDSEANSRLSSVAIRWLRKNAKATSPPSVVANIAILINSFIID